MRYRAIGREEAAHSKARASEVTEDSDLRSSKLESRLADGHTLCQDDQQVQGRVTILFILQQIPRGLDFLSDR